MQINLWSHSFFYEENLTVQTYYWWQDGGMYGCSGFWLSLLVHFCLFFLCVFHPLLLRSATIAVRTYWTLDFSTRLQSHTFIALTTFQWTLPDHRDPPGLLSALADGAGGVRRGNESGAAGPAFLQDLENNHTSLHYQACFSPMQDPWLTKWTNWSYILPEIAISTTAVLWLYLRPGFTHESPTQQCS